MVATAPSGFVTDGITAEGKLGYVAGWNYGSRPVGDINQDGIDDFYVSASYPGTSPAVGQAYLVFGQCRR